MQMNRDKLMKMAGAVRTGAKGSVRRKKMALHQTARIDDIRLQSTLKRMGVNTILAIEEVNISKDDVIIQFTNPKDGEEHSTRLYFKWEKLEKIQMQRKVLP